MEKQKNSIEIETSIQKCYQAICDFESYPQWQDPVKCVNILDKDDQNRPLVVEYELQILKKKINYTLRYHYKETDSQCILRWDYVGGDIKNIEGSYTFDKLDEQKTRATYDLAVELGIWVPKAIIKKLKEVNIIDSIKALKKRAETS